MFSPSPIQLLIVLVIALLLFGNRLPSIMRSLGKSVVEFKKGVNGIEEGMDDAMKSAEKNAKKPAENVEKESSEE